jgi:signal transduction histidine kinase/DNA-binding response OmpR family regulator/HPt (histidine-containing phosphotransfer) domain-containing protein
VTTPDPLAAVRAEFAAGLGQRIQTMRTALERLDQAFDSASTEVLYRAAHSLTGTAASFGAQSLAHVAADLEDLARGWLRKGEAPSEERRVAAAAVAELDAAAREYRAASRSGGLRSPAARLAVVGELTSLINAAVDMREIFQGAILKVRDVLDFRRASVVLTDESSEHYYLHTLYDKARGGFVPGTAVFPITQGVTGEAIRTGRPIRVDALHGTDGILLHEGAHVSAMIVPLHVGDRVIGALNFGHEEPGRYTEEDLDWAVVLGRQIETSLYYSKLLSTIAEQREALARQHAAVERQRNQLEALIDASDAAIMLVGPDRKVAYANTEMTQLVGIPREAVLGASVDSVHRFLAGSFVNPDALTVQETTLSLDASLHDRVEFAFPRRAVYQRVVAPVQAADRTLLGHIVLYRDVTHEVQAERMKSEFVSVVSHELRTPMTSVKTSLSLLLAGAEGPLNHAARQLLEIAVRNADRLIRLVNDLLDLSRLEAGRMKFQLEPVHLADTVAAGVEMLAAVAAEKGVTIVPAPVDESLIVLGVRDRVLQVIVNLLSNAIKFAPRGGRVDLRCRRDGTDAVAEVADQGPGIPADMLEVIFEPFRQLDGSNTREHGGAGLGLAISRGIVEALGGSVWAESEVGRGSRFFVRLPLAPAEPEGALGEEVPQEATVLLVHGDADWRHLAASLETAGWRVLPLVTGREALALPRERSVDLVVTALELPDMHGLEFLQRLRRAPESFDIPALLVADGSASAQALEYGADGCVPPDPQALVGAARRLVAARSRPLVLLVDDDPAVRASLSKAVRRAGYACWTARDAAEGLESARHRRPSVIVTDYQLPGMNGLAFLKELRAQPDLRDVPAIMLSAHDLGDLVSQVRELGAHFSAKPVESRTFVRELRKLVPTGAP